MLRSPISVGRLLAGERRKRVKNGHLSCTAAKHKCPTNGGVLTT